MGGESQKELAAPPISKATAQGQSTTQRRFAIDSLESPKYAAVRQEAEAEIQKLEKNTAIAESVVHASYLGDEVGRLKLLISKIKCQIFWSRFIHTVLLLQHYNLHASIAQGDGGRGDGEEVIQGE